MSDNLLTRLGDLLRDPREDLGVEAKSWLDLATPEHKAVLAKALLAIANHGGGYVLIGFDDSATGLVPSQDRPATLNGYSQDIVNGIVQAFAEPAFHCSVAYVPGPGGIHPVISVPGGHRVPIKAKKGSPNNTTVITNAIYIRRPGPRSEPPQTAQEWDILLGRCLAARKDELIESMRGLLSGSVGLSPRASPDAEFSAWTIECVKRWGELIAPLPNDDEARCPHGHFWFAYEINADFPAVRLPELKGIVDRSTRRTSGWPPWWVPTRQGISPYPKDGTLECWLAQDEHRTFADAAHSDFWKISPAGRAFLLRGYQEDGDRMAQSSAVKGSLFEVALPILRNAEALLQAESFARNLQADNGTLTYRACYAGLAGRHLSSTVLFYDIVPAYVCRDEQAAVEITAPTSAISANLPEIVHEMLQPLYERFDLYDLKIDMVRCLIKKLLSGELF